MAIQNNPEQLLRLAQPLLDVIDALKPELDSAAKIDQLHDRARSALRAFAEATPWLASDKAQALHYCLCAALDQAGNRVRGRAGSMRGAWLQRSLLREFHDERGLGQQCRARLTALLGDAGANADALAVLSALMARGLADEHGEPLAMRIHMPNPVPVARPASRPVRPARPASAPAQPPQRPIRPAPRAPQAPQAPQPQRRPQAMPVPTRQQRPSRPAPERLQPTPEPTPTAIPAPARKHRSPRWHRLLLALAIAALLAALVYLYWRSSSNARVTGEAVAVIETAPRQDRLHLALNDDLLFAPEQADLLPAQSEALERIAAQLAAASGKVTIIGHSDASVGATSNLTLSERRALAVARYLEDRGVARERIEVIGRGDAQPQSANDNAPGRARNRRVEIVLTPAPASASAGAAHGG